VATADQYAEWIVKNADKKGTEEFNTVAQAYKEAQQQEQANKGIGARLAEQTGKEIESVKAAPVRATTDIVNRGLIGNTLGGPVDILNAGIRAYHALSNAAMSPFGYENKWQPSEAPVGGGEWFGQQMERGNMVSSERRPVLEAVAGLAPLAPSAARGAANIAKTAVMTPVNVAKGMLMNPPETSLYKVDDYFKPAAVEGYKQGLITKQELQNPENIIPREQLFTTPADRMALRIAGNQVPARGKVAEATGERIAQDYSGQYGPFKLAADIATPLMTGLPPPLITRRVAQGLADKYLGNKYNYDPEFLAKYRADTGVPPTTPPGLPPVGPAIPPAVPPSLPPQTPPGGPVAGPAVPQLTYRPTPTTMYAGQTGAAGGDINQVSAAELANKYNPALNFKPSLPPAAEGPAQQAAAQAGITPPINAIESGFNNELASIKGPAVPENIPVQQPMPKPVQQPAVGMTALEQPVPEVLKPVVSNERFIPKADENRSVRLTEPHTNTPLIEQAIEEKVAANPALEEFTKSYAKHPSIAEPIGQFLRGDVKDAVVYGKPGTGKSALTREWKNQNPNGEIQTIERQTFDAEKLKELKERSLLVDTPTLYRVEEANLLTPKQVEMLNDLQKSTTRNGRFVITTNDYKALDPSLKGGNLAQINMDVKLTPEQKSVYALKVAKEYNVDKTPAEIEAIAQNSNNNSYRKIKDEVSAGYSNKDMPLMSEHGDASDAMAGKLPPKVLKELDDWNNNLSNNLVIFDKPTPDVSKSLDRWVPQTSDINVIENALYKNTTASPTYRFVVRTEKDAKDIAKLKNAISDSNETKFPTKIIIEDYTGKLEPALYSRAKKYTAKELTPENASPTGMSALEDLTNRPNPMDTLFDKAPTTTSRPNNPNIMSMMAEETPAAKLGTFDNPYPSKAAITEGQGLFDVMKSTTNDIDRVHMEGKTKVERLKIPDQNLDVTAKYSREGKTNVTEYQSNDGNSNTTMKIYHTGKHKQYQDMEAANNWDPLDEWTKGFGKITKKIDVTDWSQSSGIPNDLWIKGVDNTAGISYEQRILPAGESSVWRTTTPVDKPTWTFTMDTPTNKYVWENDKLVMPQGQSIPHPLGKNWNQYIDTNGEFPNLPTK
jgi:hypothetical protein